VNTNKLRTNKLITVLSDSFATFSRTSSE